MNENSLVLFLWRLWNAPPVLCGELNFCDLCKTPFRCTLMLRDQEPGHTHRGWLNQTGTDHLKGQHFKFPVTSIQISNPDV